MEKRFFLFAAFLSLLVSCGDDFSSSGKSSEPASTDNDEEVSSSSTEVPSYLNSMLLIEGSSTKVVLGTKNKNALSSEKPQMNVIIDYDYFMDVHEVSCGEYAAALKEAKKDYPSCKNDSLPIVDITYYDAILWANVKSKNENIDTVYDYTKAIFDDEGHCTYLNSLVFHPEREGFRLPTEAEWIKAASIDWDSTNSWNAGNSDYKLHKICTQEHDSTQFCDLAGNAMEWVNDWLGKFKDTTVTNYIGATDGGEIGERILKGGSYNTNESAINRYSRGDVYTVTSSTRAEYVGFRLAYGVIKNPLWLSNDGKVQESIVNVLADPTEIYRFAKSYKVKLAFRNDETSNLAFIDYTDGLTSVVEISDTINVYHPEISPNGSHVAFCTSFEGVTGNSSLYVRDLDAEGSNLVKLDVKTAAIPRWKVLDNGDTVIVYVTDAGVNQDSSTWKSYSTWQVSFNNGKFGKPTKLFDGSFHGGISEDNRLAITGARLLRAKIAGKDAELSSNSKETIWYNKEQACNASLAQDYSKRTAFLDFAGKTGKEFVGKSYSVHQHLLIADSTGKLIQSIEAPKGYTFDHSEWVVGDAKDNLVATLTNANGAHRRITLINLKDSVTLDLAEGEELWHPSFWIEKRITLPPTHQDEPSTTPKDSTEEAVIDSSNTDFQDTVGISDEEEPFVLDLDSAGMYYQSGVSDKAAIMRYKMELLWQYHDSVNVVILGSSRPKNGVKPLSFSDSFKAINLADSYFSINESYFIYNNYLQSQTPKLRYLIVSLDIDMWWKEINSYKNFFYKDHLKIPGYVYDKNHNFWKDSVPQGLYQATYDGLGTSTGKIFRETLGFHPFAAADWGGEDLPIYNDSSWYQEDSTLFYASLDLLKSIIKSASERDIHVIGVIFPQSPGYKNTGAYGAYGLQRSIAPRLTEIIANLEDTYDNFIFFDENKMGDHDYGDDLARDRDHLAEPGADVMTARLDSILKVLDQYRQ